MKSALISALLLLSLGGTTAAIADENELSRPIVAQNSQVDYAGFTALTQKLGEYRSNRLVTLDQFIALAAENDAVILGTRSTAAFQFGHIDGAINIPFSDFTDAKLEKLLGDKKRSILIYCNNNFRNNVFPVARKSAPLALNIPTFINLYGYGYENIYELNDVILTSDPRITWARLRQDS